MVSGNVTPRNRSSLRHPDSAPAAGRASSASRCPTPFLNQQSLLFINAAHVPVCILPVDAGEGAVFEDNVVFVAGDGPFDSAQDRLREGAFGDAPGTDALHHRLAVDHRWFSGAQLDGDFADFE